MNINYLYFLYYIKSCQDYQNLKILDYGCGKGEILNLLIKERINSLGVDIYHQGASMEVLNNILYKTGKIKIIKFGEKLPFDDDSFDIIISNQVFEHLLDIKFVIKELSRILKKDGKMYHHFPSKEVWREGHIGIPFSHWFSKRSKLRFYYVFLMRIVGFGNNKKNNLDIKQWTKHSCDYLDKFCYYRKYKNLKNIFFEYDISHKEISYIKYRGEKIFIAKYFLKINFLTKIYEYIFRKVAFMAIELRMKNEKKK